jgi:hypothetical protein
LANAGSDPRVSQRRKAAERTSVFVGTHRPSRGGAGTGDLSGGSPSRSRENESPGAGMSERGSALQRSARMTRRCAVRFEEGPRPSKDSANLHSGRPGPGTRAPSGACRARLVSPCRPREGAAEGQGGEGSSPLTAAYEDFDASAVSARASHGLQKSLGRLRAQRSAPPVRSGSKAWFSTTERVNGGSATSHVPSARAQGLAPGERKTVGRGSAILIT